MYKIMEPERVTDVPQMVFAAFYCDDAQPYLNYPHVKKERDRDRVVPMMLMLYRWDQLIGFPGGKVDPGEDLRTALYREIEEEIFWKPTTEPRHLCSHTNVKETVGIHCYSFKVEFNELKRIKASAELAEHAIAECGGPLLVHCADYGNGKGYKAFRHHNFSATAGMEADILVTRNKWDVG